MNSDTRCRAEPASWSPSHALGQEAGDKASRAAVLRRLETQADCFSGMFMRAVSQSIGVQQQDEDGILNIYVAIGDDKLSGKPDIVGNHGLAQSRKYWGTTGLGNSSVGACNTFVVPPKSRAIDDIAAIARPSAADQTP